MSKVGQCVDADGTEKTYVSSDTLLASLFQLSSASSSSVSVTHSASTLLQQNKRILRFSSGSLAFNSLLTVNASDPGVGGLTQGSLLELSGAPGEGKTRSCISFAINVCLTHSEAHGLPTVLIIDTQGSIPMSELYEAAVSACDGEPKAVFETLDQIVLWTSTERDDMLAALYVLPHWLNANPSVKLVILDSLTSPLSAYLVPALSSQIINEQEISDKCQHSSKKRRTNPGLPGFANQDAAHSLIRTLLATVLKKTLLTLSARKVSVIVTTQSKTKLTDDFGENATLKEAKHSFAVPQFTNFWHIPDTTQIVLSAGPAGVRTAMATVAPSISKGKTICFRTTTAGIADLSA
ncbi:MAG: DNA repair protein rad51c [Cyphobasidiales sp. Tagirdzhanova-0007]|nr:MAG: DNA repair protein rad51c [Cyphobasidiales sp. Tagirdzhanova-0007]